MTKTAEPQQLRIAAIVSMKAGMELFVYRELSMFTELGHQLVLLPTKVGRGLYTPRPDWEVCRWRWPGLLWAQLTGLLSAPKRYLHLLREAQSTRSFADLVLAWGFRDAALSADILYANFGDHKFFVGYYLKRITNRPLVVTIHAYELYKNPNQRLFRRALAAADQVITVTEYNREMLQQHFGLEPSRVEVVRINVDTVDFYPADRFRILIVGSFVERKGHEILFRALKSLNRDDLEVWVVGDQGGENYNVDVPALAREIGVDDQVAFFGSLKGNALKAVFRACNVFCLPSRMDHTGVCEGFPTVIAEAMAFGKPVISTKHVEIPRVLPEVVVPENDAAALADALMQVAASQELRDRLGRQNRRIAENHFSLKNAQKTAEILSRQVSKQPPESR